MLAHSGEEPLVAKLSLALALTLTVSAAAAGRNPPDGTVALGAPVKAAVHASGHVVTGALRVGGVRRTYRVYLPRDLGSRHAPLLVALHGGLGSGSEFERDSGFDGLAEANRFIVVYPDGTSIVGRSQRRVWNAGGCCGRAARDNVDDVAFVSALIDTLERRYAIDAHRIFVTGHSNGAMLGLRLACELAGKIAAVAVQSGTLFVDRCRPSKPVAVMELHGHDDENVPIGGGRGSRDISGSDYPPPLAGLQTLAHADGCPAAAKLSRDPHNHDVAFHVWSPCRRRTAVEWVTVAGAGHAWMGHSLPPLAERLVGKPYPRYDAAVACWSFLAAHPRR